MLPYTAVPVQPVAQGYALLAHMAAAAAENGSRLGPPFRAERMQKLIDEAREEAKKAMGGPAYNLMEKAYHCIPTRARGSDSTLGAISNLEQWVHHPKATSPPKRKQVQAFLKAIERVSLEAKAA